MQIKGCESSSLAIILGKVDMTSLFGPLNIMPKAISLCLFPIAQIYSGK